LTGQRLSEVHLGKDLEVVCGLCSKRRLCLISDIFMDVEEGSGDIHSLCLPELFSLVNLNGIMET
jgi:hypothetical protein